MRTNRILAEIGIAVVALLLVCAAAKADTVRVDFTGVGGQNQNGYYTYPYYLSLNRGDSQPTVCDDFYDEIQPGDHWQATITRLIGGDMSQTMFHNFGKYEEAGFLLLQMTDANKDQWANINWAIWMIFDPDAHPGSEYEQAVEQWIKLAKGTDFSKVDLSSVEILTPTWPGPQEFLFLSPLPSPEPGTLLLAGGGILGLWVGRLRRKA